MDFLITNMTGFRNKGCEAMTKVIIRELKAMDSAARIHIFTHDPAYDSLWVGEEKDISFLASPFRIGLWKLPERWLYWGMAKFGYVGLWQRGFMEKTLEAFRRANAVLSTGGDIFSSYYGPFISSEHIRPLRIAKSFKKPLFLIAHTIGPFRTSEERDEFVGLMKHAALITVRESISYQYVKNMDFRGARIELTADPAFNLMPVDEQCVEMMWRAYHLPFDQQVVGMIPSQGIAGCAGVSYAEHFKALKETAQFIAEKLNYHVLLIPHVRETRVANDDIVICNKLYRELELPENVTVLSLDHTAEEIRGIIGNCDLIIAERTHGAIAGLAQTVPTLVVSYSVKSEGIFEDVFGRENATKYVIPIKELNGEVLRSRVEDILEEEHDPRRHLADVIPRVRDRAKQNFTLIMDALRK